jgi:hypothetical protein
VARDLLITSLDSQAGTDLAAEARRQSLLALTHPSEAKSLLVLADLADLRGWE